VKLKKANEEETLSQFAERWGVSVELVVSLNPGTTIGSGFFARPIEKCPGTVNLQQASLNLPDDAVESIPSVPVIYDLTKNNAETWDWILWETEGNSDPKYQRGGKERKLGLYSLNYNKLRCAGSKDWAPKHTDGTVGGGWVKIAILNHIDYSQHQNLIKTFLPCLASTSGKVIGEASEEELVREWEGAVSRSTAANKGISTFDSRPPLIVMPFNYDDNSSKSKAIGVRLNDDPIGNADATRLKESEELTRWATASRSTITAFPDTAPKHIAHSQQRWSLRPNESDDGSLPQVVGPPDGKTLYAYQADDANSATQYYSVKTGVDYVATQNQSKNDKDLLESNSIHAMSRSDIIAGTINRRGKSRFDAEYQLEILSILLGGGERWDGIQVREIGNAGRDEIWFPALAIPTHGKAFAKAWGSKCDWREFWRDNFARPLGWAKAEMLAYFGLQHMTSNAQNFLIVFDRKNPGSKAKRVVLRDIGDTILNTPVFDVLKTVDGPLFKTAWDKEIADKKDGIVLEMNPSNRKIGGGYANPQITRIGTGIVFFFLPFLKGDVDTERDPKTAKIAADWGVESNLGFFDYMKERLAYEPADTGIDRVPGDLKESIWHDADISQSGQTVSFANLSAEILKLSSIARLGLLDQLDAKIRSFVPKNKTEVDELQAMVAGHEILICAEIHQFIQSEFGRNALVYLHDKGGRSASQVCCECKADLRQGLQGTLRCSRCGAKFCARCASKLPYPRGTSPSLRAIIEGRRCTEESHSQLISGTCDGSAEPFAT